MDVFIERKRKEMMGLWNQSFLNLAARSLIEELLVKLSEKRKKPKASMQWLENVVAQIRSHCGKDGCGDIEFNEKKAEDDLREGLKEIGVEVD